MEILTSLPPLTSPDALYSTVQQVQAELAGYRAIIDRSPAVVILWRIAPGWPIDFVSAGIRQFGYTPDDFLSGRVTGVSMTHPDDLPRLEEQVAEWVARGVESFRQEYRILTADGQVRWVDDQTVAIRDAAGGITHYQGILLDITVQKEAESRLRAACMAIEA
jgi:PAS domain S-box-containing protein